MFLKLFRKRQLLEIKGHYSRINGNYFSLISIKARKVNFELCTTPLEDLGECEVPAFSLFTANMIFGNELKGFSIIQLTETDEKFIVDTNFIENYCINTDASLYFKDGSSCKLGWTCHYLPAEYVFLLPKIKAMLVSIFTQFEQEAVDAFKFGVIDVFLNMLTQLEKSKKAEENDEILFEVYDYMNKVFNTLLDMKALKEIRLVDSSVAFKILDDYEENKTKLELLEEKQRKEERSLFLSQISARKELLDDFNKPLETL